MKDLGLIVRDGQVVVINKIGQGGNWMAINTINTHEKLMSALFNRKISGVDIYKKLKAKGYLGEEKEIPSLIIDAMSNTDAYTMSDQDMRNPDRHITKEDYFQMLADEMNIAL